MGRHKTAGGTIDFIPIKHRVRITRSGHPYNDPRNKKQEAAIAAAYEGDVFTGAVALNVDIYPKLPKSRPKRVTSEPHTLKPDIDNITKSVMDGLTGAAYKDDSQVTKVTVTKHDRTRRDSDTTVFTVIKDTEGGI